MSKDFKKKYMHPTRRKLVDMVQTGVYDKNTQIGWTKTEQQRNVGDVWEDEHNRYEKKEGYILKTGKNSEALQEIRKYLEEKSKCKNPECKTLKKSEKDLKFIQKGGFCLNCTVDREHEIKTAGLWIPYEDYKIATRMIVYGKTKLEELRQSLSEIKEQYEMIGSDGKVTETWKLPKPIEEVKAEIQEMIDNGEKELEVIIEKRNEAFNQLKEKNYEHYI